MLHSVEYMNDPAPWVNVHHAFDEDFANMLLDHFPEPYSVEYTGTREVTNKFRKFITRKDTPELAEVFAHWDTTESRDYFTEISRRDCSDGKLRVELCQDNAGFYLDKHIDINEKLITLQVYLGDGHPSWGTTIYNADHSHYYTNEFRHNTGWMSFKDSPLWHGVEKSAAVASSGLRRSIIINYVHGDWRDTHQLY
jgi:hypothetical protein